MKKYITQVQDRLAWGRSREELDRAGRSWIEQEGGEKCRKEQNTTGMIRQVQEKEGAKSGITALHSCGWRQVVGWSRRFSSLTFLLRWADNRH